MEPPMNADEIIVLVPRRENKQKRDPNADPESSPFYQRMTPHQPSRDLWRSDQAAQLEKAIKMNAMYMIPALTGVITIAPTERMRFPA